MTTKQEPDSTHSSSSTGYVVEARSTSDPIVRGKQIFDREWKRVQFQESALGVPRTKWRTIGVGLEIFDLYEYASAQALRWWFIAEESFTSSLETRLVRYHVGLSANCKRGEAEDEVGDSIARMTQTPRENV